MTAGAGYEYLTREVATARHDYYAGQGEKAGEWWGGGLARLGLAGEVTTEQTAALYGEAVDPRTGDPLGRRFPVFRWLEERVNAAVEAWTAEHGSAPTGDQTSPPGLPYRRVSARPAGRRCRVPRTPRQR